MTLPRHGSRSTGSRSMAFMAKIQTNTGERQRRDQLAAGGVVDHALAWFSTISTRIRPRPGSARHARSGLARAQPQQPAGQCAQQDRPEHRVGVEQAEVDDVFLRDVLRTRSSSAGDAGGAGCIPSAHPFHVQRFQQPYVTSCSNVSPVVLRGALPTSATKATQAALIVITNQPARPASAPA